MEINVGTFTGLENSEGASVLLNWNKATVNGGTFDGSAAIPGYTHYAVATGSYTIGSNYATTEFTIQEAAPVSDIENPNTIDNSRIYLLIAAVAVSSLFASAALSKRS